MFGSGEASMKLSHGLAKLLLWGGVTTGLVLFSQSARAQTANMTGEYECTEAKVAGKPVPCKSAPLSLKSDGRFELQGREGEYLVTGTWVELNGAVLKSRAKIEAGHKIVFRFYNKKGLCEMIYERRVAELGKTKLS
jgi:hypothetical protein